MMILSPILRPRADMEMSLMAAGECALLFAVCCVEVVEIVELLLGAGDLGTPEGGGGGGKGRSQCYNMVLPLPSGSPVGLEEWLALVKTRAGREEGGGEFCEETSLSILLQTSSAVTLNSAPTDLCTPRGWILSSIFEDLCYF